MMCYMNQWLKDIAQKQIGNSLYLSVPFTWLLPKALEIAKSHKGKVFAGGPAVKLMPDYLANVAKCNIELPGSLNPLEWHNPLATFTTRGCVNACGFCAVPKIEGEFVELKDFPVKPVVCDNNFLASSKAHFDRVIDRLKCLPYVDFNQGLDARLFTAYHAGRLAELKKVCIRFAFDDVNLEGVVADAFALAKQHGHKDFGCYVLIGFDDTPDEALYKLEKVRSWGILPNPMRYQPLDAIEKNSYVAPGWTEYELRRVMKYYSRLCYYEHVPFSEFRNEGCYLFDYDKVL